MTEDAIVEAVVQHHHGLKSAEEKAAFLNRMQGVLAALAPVPDGAAQPEGRGDALWRSKDK